MYFLAGWWLAQSVDDNSQGWVPATYLEPIAATGSEESSISLHKYEKFVATCDYKSSQPDELSVHKGALVEVTQKSFDGWWHCRYCLTITVCYAHLVWLLMIICCRSGNINVDKYLVNIVICRRLLMMNPAQFFVRVVTS